MGWTRKILRVDLNAGTCKSEPLNMKWADEYLGSRGLATKYFCEEVDPKVDPLSPERIAQRRAFVLDFVSAALFK